MYKKKIIRNIKWQDKASSYHRNFLDYIITFFFTLKFNKIKIGKNTIIKRKNEFKLSSNAEIKIGNNSILKESSFFLLTKPRPKLLIGDHVGIGRNSYIAIKSTLNIGSYTRTGHNLTILDNEHDTKNHDYIMNQNAIIKEISIGKDCWIGSNVTILKGVRIHDGAVIGASSLVNKEIGPNEIWAGNPARFIRKRS